MSGTRDGPNRSGETQDQPVTFLLLLRLVLEEPILFRRRMRSSFKLGVSLLSLALLATPTMACLLPAASITPAEQECCKRMVGECGKAGMPQSHPCCQTTTVPDQFAAIKSSVDVNSLHVMLGVTHTLGDVLIIPSLQALGSGPWAADIHSPPISPPASISVLRI
jgi:hypothetical protein